MSVMEKRTTAERFTVDPRQELSFSIDEPEEFMGTVAVVSEGHYRKPIYFTVHGSFFVRHTHTFDQRLAFERKLKQHVENWWLTTEDGQGKDKPHAVRINYRSRYRKLLVRAADQKAHAGENA